MRTHTNRQAGTSKPSRNHVGRRFFTKQPLGARRRADIYDTQNQFKKIKQANALARNKTEAAIAPPNRKAHSRWLRGFLLTAF